MSPESEQGDANQSVRKKVDTIFREWAGNRADALIAGKVGANLMSTIGTALTPKNASSDEIAGAYDVGFHVGDWSTDAAFIVALALFPEHFTRDEIEAGVDALIFHARSHLFTAARLRGAPVNDLSTDDPQQII